jgi:titin
MKTINAMKMVLLAAAVVVGAVLRGWASATVNVDWNASPETDLWGYRIYYSSSVNLTSISTTSAAANVAVRKATVVGATTLQVGSLASGQTYQFRMTAIDTSGNESTFSVLASTVLPSIPPTAPTGMTATSVSNTMNVSWNDNADDETSYQLERSVDGGAFALLLTLGANVVGVTDTGLTAGSSYSYRVRAVGPGGTSAYSNVATATAGAAPTIPTAPSALTATAASSSQINLAWTDNSNNETGFEIQRSLNGTSGWTAVVTTAAGAVAYANTGLSSSTAYYYRVRASNSAGSSAWTAAANATTQAGPPPVPTGLAATVISATQLNVSWSAASGATGYTLQVQVGSGAWTDVVTQAGTSYSHAGLTPSTSYSYRVLSTNGSGLSSAYSAASTARTTLPAAPTGLQASSVASTRVTLVWSPVTGATGYIVERSVTGGAFTQLAAPTSSSYQDATVTAELQVAYRVRAVNASGNSLPSTELSLVIPANVVINGASMDRKFLTRDNTQAVFSDATEVEVWDMRGNQVFHQSGDGLSPLVWDSETSDGRRVESGAYIVKILGVDGKELYKTIVVAK